jgi:hypothetical protein
VANADLGANEPSSGNIMLQPTPRRTVRRLIGWMYFIVCLPTSIGTVAGLAYEHGVNATCNAGKIFSQDEIQGTTFDGSAEGGEFFSIDAFTATLGRDHLQVIG